MKIKELILEYNLQNLLSLFQEKYKEIKQKDTSNTHNTLDQFIKSIEDPLRRDNKFQFIDPYMKWIVQRYVTGKLNKYEDVMSKVIPGLLTYDSLKRKNKLKPEHKDINGIKDIDQLLDVLDQYKEEDTKSDKEKEKEIEENFYRNGEAELIHNDSDLKIVVPKSERASCFFGRNTRWCTAATEGENYFERYNSEGNLYILILKKENKRFQFHFETEQFMDEKDEPIDFKEFYISYPRVYDILGKISKKYNTVYFGNIEELKPDDLRKIIFKDQYNFVDFVISMNSNLLHNEDFLIDYLTKNPLKIKEFYEKNKISDEILKKIIKKDVRVFKLLLRQYGEMILKIDAIFDNDFIAEMLNYNPHAKDLIFEPLIRRKLNIDFFKKIKNKEIFLYFLKSLNLANIQFEKDLILSFLLYNKKIESEFLSLMQTNTQFFLHLFKMIKTFDNSKIVDLVLKKIFSRYGDIFLFFCSFKEDYIKKYYEIFKDYLKNYSDSGLPYFLSQDVSLEKSKEIYKKFKDAAKNVIEFAIKNKLNSLEKYKKMF